MRDYLVMGIVLGAGFMALRRPWIGVLLWVWISIMNPHRLTFGFAYDAPVAAIAAISTLIGLLATKQRESPFKGPPLVWLAVFFVVITLSWLLGLDPNEDYWQWNKIAKIFLMLFVGTALLRSKLHIIALAWVTALSMGLLGAKGGWFTITSGGAFRVWGPSGSFIEDNNEFALACVVAIPLLRFMQMQLVDKRGKFAMTLLMLLCVASALGSQSRGSFLALVAMGGVLWWRSKGKMMGAIVIVTVALVGVWFMPSSWSDRMNTIENYGEDASAQGRISAWWNAWNLAFHYPLGVGFNAARHDLFEKYSPIYAKAGTVHAAHSIYFQVLGNHGFVGLFLFLMIWLSTWSSANWLRKHGAQDPQSRWAADLGGMCQVALAGYLFGGAFLSLAYFDLPYDVMSLVVLARAWVARRGWLEEPAYGGGWRALPGMQLQLPKAKTRTFA